MGSRLAVALVAAAIAAPAAGVASTSAPQGPAATCGKLLPPTSGIYFGLNPDFSQAPDQLEGQTVSRAAIDEFVDVAGRRPVVVSFVQHWFRGLEFPRDKILTIWRAGAVPYVRMHAHSGSPFGVGNPPEEYPGIYSLQNIIDGRFDDALRKWADAARASNIPIVMEFGDEENADWGPWGGLWNGAGETRGYGDPTFPDGPERFRDAYRHMVTLFRNEGATNVTWVFHMVEWFQPNRPWESFANYYPGDNYVDWLALSLFGLNNLPDGGLGTFEQELATFHGPGYPGNYGDITSLGPQPLSLMYVGVTPKQGDAVGWINGMFETVHSGRYPRIAMLSWFNSDDWGSKLLPGTPTGAALHTGAASSVFGAKPRFTGNCLPSAPKVRAKGRVVRWTAVPNATSYEVWRGTARVSMTTGTSYRGRAGRYRVRGVNPLGAGPFGSSQSRPSA